MNNKATFLRSIAIVMTGGNLDIPKGLINACINRYKHLIKYASDYDVKLYYLTYKIVSFSFKSVIYSLLYRKRTLESLGCQVCVLTKYEFVSRNVIQRKILKLYYRTVGTKALGNDWQWVHSFAHYFKNYCLLSVHSDLGAYLGVDVKNTYGIPYFATWHGSDIHTIPFENPTAKKLTSNAIKNARGNFFVSKSLLMKSDLLVQSSNKAVLYNGVDGIFHRYSDTERLQLRASFSIRETAKVVAFAGTLRDIKNASLLPLIFQNIKNRFAGDVVFWIIGNGPLEQTISSDISELNIDCQMLGYIESQNMPSYLNCVDVLVLPSKNEGLPLIAIEALSCGANVVGSKVGGIPEVIGEGSCVDFGPNYIDLFAEKVVCSLAGHYPQPVNPLFSWDKTAEIESQYYSRALNIL